MDTKNPTYLKDLMRINVYANTSKREIAVLMDRPFDEHLQFLELHKNDGILFFQFPSKRLELGNKIEGNVLSIMVEHNFINVIQIDIHTKEALDGRQVPLKIFE